MLNVKYIDASIDQIKRMNNLLLKQSSGFATKMYHKGLISSKRPYFNEDTTKLLYNSKDCYDKTGKLTEAGKDKVFKMVKKFCGTGYADIKKFMNTTIRKYR